MCLSPHRTEKWIQEKYRLRIPHPRLSKRSQDYEVGARRINLPPSQINRGIEGSAVRQDTPMKPCPASGAVVQRPEMKRMLDCDCDWIAVVIGSEATSAP
jgi:hypothetical protein